MPFYVSETTFDIVVEASNKKEAIKVAKENIHDEIYNTDAQPIRITTRPINTIQDVPKVWRDAIPWGSTNNLSCHNIFFRKTHKQIRCEKCKNTSDLFEQEDHSIICKTCLTKL